MVGMVPPVAWGVLLFLAMPVNPSVLKDLNSPEFAVRDRARETLRASFQATSANRWNELKDSLRLKKGEPAAQVADICRQVGITLNVLENDGTYSSHVRLDSSWMLICSFHDGLLEDFTISMSPPIILNEPPPLYSGLWRTYRENGELVSADYYVRGIKAGPLSDGGDTHVTEPRNAISNVQVHEEIQKTGEK